MMDVNPIILTLELAFISTVLLFFIAAPLAYWLAFTTLRIKPVVEAIITLPLVLPPTVLGFYLLIAFSPNNFFGKFLNESLGFQLVFSFEGLVFASIIYSLPFMVQPIYSGFTSFPAQLINAAKTMGKSNINVLWNILLPGIKPSLITGFVLAFAHTIGEFGVVLMIGGNIPGETRVASIAIYDEVESLNYGTANAYSLILLAITFSILLLVFLYNQGYLKRIK